MSTCFYVCGGLLLSVCERDTEREKRGIWVLMGTLQVDVCIFVEGRSVSIYIFVRV